MKAELTWDLLNGRPIPADQQWNSATGDIATLGFTLNAVLQPWRTAVAPYLALGGGVYWMQRVGGDPSPYGDTYGVHAAGGLDFDVDLPIRPFVELRGLLHFTDYGSNEWSPTTYLTLRGGLQVEW